MADTAATIMATTVRVPSTMATTPPDPTGARTPGTARRNSATMRKYAGTISNHASGLNGGAFTRQAGTAAPRGERRALIIIIEADARGSGISIGSNISDIGRLPAAHRIRLAPGSNELLLHISEARARIKMPRLLPTPFPRYSGDSSGHSRQTPSTRTWRRHGVDGAAGRASTPTAWKPSLAQP